MGTLSVQSSVSLLPLKPFPLFLQLLSLPACLQAECKSQSSSLQLLLLLSALSGAQPPLFFSAGALTHSHTTIRPSTHRYHDPARGQPPHLIPRQQRPFPQLIFKAPSWKTWRGISEEVCLIFSTTPHLNCTPPRGLLQEHECEEEKGWAGHQLAEVLLNPGSLEERYSHLLSCLHDVGEI